MEGWVLRNNMFICSFAFALHIHCVWVQMIATYPGVYVCVYINMHRYFYMYVYVYLTF